MNRNKSQWFELLTYSLSLLAVSTIPVLRRVYSIVFFPVPVARPFLCVGLGRRREKEKRPCAEKSRNTGHTLLTLRGSLEWIQSISLLP